MVPVTPFGKFLSCICIIIGVSIFALPAGILGTGLALKVFLIILIFIHLFCFEKKLMKIFLEIRETDYKYLLKYVSIYLKPEII